ncbi:DEAD/DEAH box helicase [Candidatus Poribacteria bacterium]|nr:DEAD/DEAH box helicase [Candidatus Poribacteria bacterium]
MGRQNKTSEQNMEEQIEIFFTESGFLKRNHSQYDKKLCMDPELVMSFIFATQPEEWEKLKEQHREQVKDKFLLRLKSEIDKRGTLDVLRKGVRDYGCHFDLAYFQPVSGLNKTLETLYKANLLSITRQVYFSENNNKSVDMVIFLNGLPISVIELKDKLSGSGYNVNSAIKQYKEDRDPKEPLFHFKRCLVFFAVDEDLVYMTTKLDGTKTRFFPFNKGLNNGAGNPPTDGYKTEYLWKEILQRDSFMNIIQHFVHVADVLDDNGMPTGEQIQIFPRYHQLDAVRKLISHSQNAGTGRNYLIQHSAGSGKSNTIAWLCHQLAGLHDKNDKRVFDTIIVVSDRRVIDRQLQETIKQFEQVDGVVKKIDKRSRQLKEALENGKNIIVTTLQKFPYIIEDIQELPGKKFAVAVDEAHSSQSGETSKSLKKVLKAQDLEDAEATDSEEETYEDEIAKEMEARGRQKNVSFFAFTATPKGKTFELFGEKQPDGTYLPFHLYSMKQAIEEGFILDVLKNYTTYKTYFNLLKKIEDDPRYDKRKATRLLRSFVDLHEISIQKKVEIIVEHYNENVKNKIPDKNGNGRAKAMVVTRSRLHAVRFKIACDKYIKERGYKFKTLAAFSGTVVDPDDGIEYTEPGMNGFSEKQTKEEYKKPSYKFLIVANKFQTGFDQPLLYAMYIDKKLSGVAAVQTLSRSNRIHLNKEEPIILDFANEADEIEQAFSDYYGTTLLSEGTDPNKLYDIQLQLSDFYVYSNEDIEAFAKLYFDRRVKQDRLNPILNEVAERFVKLTNEKKEEFKKLLRSYIRLYAFLSQIIPFKDPGLEKLYVFGRMLIRKLPIEKDRLPVEVMDQVDMDSYRIQLISDDGINLDKGEGELQPISDVGTKLTDKKDKEILSKIIEDINDRFGTDFSDSDKVIIQQMQSRMESNPSLKTSAKVNSKQKVKMTFGHLFDDVLDDMYKEHFDFYRRINDGKEVKAALLAMMFEQAYEKLAQA